MPSQIKEGETEKKDKGERGVKEETTREEKEREESLLKVVTPPLLSRPSPSPATHAS